MPKEEQSLAESPAFIGTAPPPPVTQLAISTKRILKGNQSNEVLDACVKAATGGTAFKRATLPLTPFDENRLSRALARPVDEWRAEFAAKLRLTGDTLLARLNEAAENGSIKPDALAYSLAVVADKAAALDGRVALSSATVNFQVNNFNVGTAPANGIPLTAAQTASAKRSMLALLKGAAPLAEMATSEAAKAPQSHPLAEPMEVAASIAATDFSPDAAKQGDE